MKKIFASFQIILFVCVATSCSTPNIAEDNSFTSAIYEVSSIEEKQEIRLGTYTLNYEEQDERRYVEEVKRYNTELLSEKVELINKKTYTFNSGDHLIECNVEELTNDEITYSASYIVDENDQVRTLLVTVNSNSSKKNFPAGEISISVNSSDLFTMPTQGIPPVGTIWFTYNPNGGIEEYESVETQWIENPLLGNVECTRIRHDGLFITNYWVAKNGLIVRIEQVMDENYTVIMELSSVEK